MKTSLRLFFCVSLFFISFSSYSISIRDALKRKLINVEILWKSPEDAESESRQHGNNLRLTVKNISKGDLSIEVPCGFMFTPLDTTRQNMIITEDILFSIKVNEQSVKYAHGYCCEASDGSPSQNEKYVIKKNASDKLIKLSEFIRDSAIVGYGTQRAIWCVSDNTDLWYINTSNPAQTTRLIKYTGELKGYAPSYITAAIDNALKKDDGVFEQMINMEVPIEKDMFVWIVIHDINNNTVRHVAQKLWVTKGMLKKDIGVSSIDFGSGDFFVRVYSQDGYVTEQKFSLDI